MNQVEHLLLGALGEVLLDIELADSLTECTAHQTYGTLPARTVLLDTTQRRAKLECLLAESIAELTGSTANDLGLGIGLQILKRRVGQNLLDLMDRFGLSHVDAVDGRHAAGQHHVAPVDAGELVDELGIAHLMIVAVDIAELHLVVAGLGDLSLDVEHFLHLALGRSLIVAHELEEMGQIGLVGLKHLFLVRVVGCVVVARAESESALPDGNEVPCGIALVSVHADAIHHRALAVAVERSRDDLILTCVLDGSDTVECRLQRSPSLAVETHAVHHQIVERSDLLSERALLLRLIGILQDEFLDTLLIEFLKVDESTVLGMLCVQRMALEPTTGGVVVEVVTGTHRGIEVAAVDTRRGSLGESACAGESQTQQYDLFFHVCLFKTKILFL